MNRYTKIKDFHGERAKGIGSSDIPILAGLTKQWGSTPFTLWEQKTGRAPLWEGNQRTEWGHRLEGEVLHKFVESHFSKDTADDYLSYKRRGKSFDSFKTDTECRSPERPYCLAHADLVVEGETPYIVEAKTAGMMSGKRREGRIFSGYDPEDLTAQGIPDAVFLQVQWQMYVYGIDLAYVAVLIDTADYREYGPIKADYRVQEKCLALAERFWELVKTDTPPAPETWGDVTKMFPDQKDTTAMISGDDEQKVREMIDRDKKLSQRAKDIKEERDDIENAIGILLGKNQFLSSAGGDILAKASEQSRESIALSKIKKDAPEIEAKLRELGLVSKSEFRVVRY